MDQPCLISVSRTTLSTVKSATIVRSVELQCLEVRCLGSLLALPDMSRPEKAPGRLVESVSRMMSVKWQLG